MGGHESLIKDRQHWQDEMERRKLLDGNAMAEFSALHRSTVDFAIASIKGTLLLNGGGSVAILSFMATSQVARSVDLLTALKLFVGGAILACLAFGVSYVSQTFFTFESGYRWANEISNDSKLKTKAKRCWRVGLTGQILGSIMVLAALSMFAWGCLSAHSALQGINGKATDKAVRGLSRSSLRILELPLPQLDLPGTTQKAVDGSGKTAAQTEKE